MPRRKQQAHYAVGQAPVHINYRLQGGISVAEKEHIIALRNEDIELAKAKLSDLPPALFEEALTREMYRINHRYEAAIERTLHLMTSGPRHLSTPTLRDVVIDSWKFLHERGELELYAICVMSNHVHVIISSIAGTSSLEIGRLMDRHKTYTGRVCNQVLNATGQSFWAPGYFDRTVRDGKFLTAMWYVINNPVKARLVTDWQKWPGTYVNPKYLSHFTE